MAAPVLPRQIVDGRYELRAELGRGGFGVVYAAHDMGLLREVALKMVAAEWTQNERIVAALQREARALASVNSLHVVQIFSFGRHRGGFYFAMERVRGRSLADLISDQVALGTTVPLPQAIRILEQVVEGLTAVHAVGLLHLDIKPDNVMIEDESGRPVLIDFGLASRDSDSREFVSGTPGYMSPEQGRLIHEPITALADVYSLACTAFELLAGVPPFGHRGAVSVLRVQMVDPPPRLSLTRPELGDLDPVFEKALSIQPADRHPSCAAFLTDLSKTIARESTARTNATASSTAASPRQPAATSVLIVNSDPDAFKTCSSAVRIALFGKRVHIASALDCAEALSLSAARPPDLVIVIHDPLGLDGLELVTRLRELPSGHRVRVLALSSADGLRLTQFRFSMLGVKHFLPVPASLRAIVDAVGLIADAAGWRDRRDAMGDQEERP